MRRCGALLSTPRSLPGDHVGLHPEQRHDAIVDAVSKAVQGMDGANWIDVMAANFPPTCPGWVIVYPRGNHHIPDTQPWRDLRHRVEETVKAAMIAAAVPFQAPQPLPLRVGIAGYS
jgi:hypothetical protein